MINSDKLVHPEKDELEKIINNITSENPTFFDIAKIGYLFDYPECDDPITAMINVEAYVEDAYKNEGSLKNCTIPQLGSAIFFQLRRMNHSDIDYNDLSQEQLGFYQEIANEIKRKIKDYKPI